MGTVNLILMILAFFCLALYGLEVKPWRGNLLGVGLALWVLAVLLAGR